MERDEIFKHVDPDTDRLNVWPNTLGGLRFNVEQGDDASNVDLDAAAVNRLHTALGTWLATHFIGQAATGLSALPDADGIRKMVREEFEELFNDRKRPAVLPLWESPASGAVSRPCGGCAEDTGVPAPLTVNLAEELPYDPNAPESDPADVPDIMAAPRLMSAVRRRSARTPIHCERCSHPYADHDDMDGCTYEYESTNRQCGCTWSAT